MTCIKHRVRNQIKRAATNSNLCRIGISKLSNHTTLMAWVFMEHINVGANQAISIKVCQFSTNVSFRILHHRYHAFIHVEDVEVSIGQHHICCCAIKCHFNAGIKGILRSLKLLRGDIRRILHNFEGVTIQIHNRVIGSVNPHFLTAFTKALIFTRCKFAPVQTFPKSRIFRACCQNRICKHPVVLALNFVKRIAHGLKEVIIGGNDRSIHVKFNNSLRFTDSVDLAFKISSLFFLIGYIRRIFYNFKRMTFLVKNRIVRRLDPNLTSAFTKAFEFSGFEFTAI